MACHPLFASLFSILLYQSTCAGTELHVAPRSLSTDYLQNSKMQFPILFAEANTIKEPGMQRLEQRVTDLEQELILENEEREEISIKVQAVHDALFTNTWQMKESAKEEIARYSDKNKDGRKWEAMEESLKKTQGVVARIPRTVAGVSEVQDHVNEVRDMLKSSKDSEDQLLSSIRETLNGYWYKGAKVKVERARDDCVRVFDAMDAEKCEIDDLLRKVKFAEKASDTLDCSTFAFQREKTSEQKKASVSLSACDGESQVADAKKKLQEYVNKFENSLENSKTIIAETKAIISSDLPEGLPPHFLLRVLDPVDTKLEIHERLMVSVKKAIGVVDKGKH